MMNHNALKNFAPAVRRQLMEAVERKLDFVLTGDTPDLRAKTEQRTSLKDKADEDRAGLIESVAYTWFNRFAALRVIDARGWHPFLCRVITPGSAGETQPEILKLTRNGALSVELKPFVNVGRINDLLDGRIPSSDSQGEVYRDLVLAACRYYHDLMPFLFEALDDETELLLPDDLLTEHSVIHGFRTAIADEDCTEVEIIGWLYQYYISEKKDQVMARKGAVPSEDIPAVTQLFTPHWIVRYLVENSLGRLWLLNHPNSRLREHMPYYIEGEPETEFLKIARPEEIRLLDPASGSGHMLTYAFDLLYLIYEEEGHAPSEIPGLILRHNLYGLEICPRATQLAQFALVCKAREKSRMAFRNSIQPQVMCLEDVCISPEEIKDYLPLPGLRELLTEKVMRQIHQFRENTATFGSLIQPALTAAEIATLMSRLASVNHGDDLLNQETHHKVIRSLDQAEMLSQRYHVVVANPPYMGSGAMNPSLKRFIDNEWSRGQGDTYAAFILRNIALTQRGGYVAMITIPNWMFIAAFLELRKLIVNEFSILSLTHCGRGVWGADFGSCAFVLRHGTESTQPGVFKRLFKKQGEVQTNAELEANFLNKSEFPTFTAENADFLRIPGVPIAYWAPRKFTVWFEKQPMLGTVVNPRQGLTTSDNNRFVRQWAEVGLSSIGFGIQSRQDAKKSRKRWFAFNKGGEFR